MKKLFLIGIVGLAGLLGSLAAEAQGNLGYDYRTALGVKVWGDGGGISIKHFVKTPNRALEGIGYFWRGGTRFTGLYEYHFDFPDAPGLKWYVGPGAHIGFYNSYNENNGNVNGYYYGSGTFIGIDGVIGLDYKFKGAPINLSLDWQPSFEFGTNRGFANSWGGLGIRYVF